MRTLVDVLEFISEQRWEFIISKVEVYKIKFKQKGGIL